MLWNKTLRPWPGIWYGLVASLVTGSIWAQTPVCDTQDPDLCSTPLEAGQKAPYAGQLLSGRLALKLGQAAEYSAQRCQLEVDRAQSQLKIDLNLAQRLLAIEQETRVQERNLLMKRLEEASTIPWYERPWFIALSTTAIVGTVAGVIIWAVLAHDAGAQRVEILPIPTQTTGIRF